MKLNEVITKLLEKDHELWNDNKRLIWAVWYTMGFTDDLGMHITRVGFYDAPSPEAITREKRRIAK